VQAEQARGAAAVSAAESRASAAEKLQAAAVAELQQLRESALCQPAAHACLTGAVWTCGGDGQFCVAIVNLA